MYYFLLRSFVSPSSSVLSCIHSCARSVSTLVLLLYPLLCTSCILSCAPRVSTLIVDRDRYGSRDAEIAMSTGMSDFWGLRDIRCVHHLVSYRGVILRGSGAIDYGYYHWSFLLCCFLCGWVFAIRASCLSVPRFSLLELQSQPHFCAFPC